MIGKAQDVEQRVAFSFPDIGGCETHIVLKAAPWQQARLLKDDREAPATMRSNVVLPQPEGPTMAPTCPSSRTKATSRSAARDCPAAPT
jgi:hypothetical protein